jgi:hypothetical protein
VLPRITEIKRNLDGTVERFTCHLLYRDPEYRVICYVSDRAYTVAAAELPAGSLTIGHYSRGRGYILWEMYDPRGNLVGYYVHLSSDLKFGDRTVEWRDMTVDVWVRSDGDAEVLDEAELHQHVAAGHISSGEASRLCQRARELCTEVPTILQGFRRFRPDELFAMLSQAPRG